jgi:hypothetical protein
MKNKIERLEMIVVLCLEKIETLERLVTELKPKEDGGKNEYSE